MSKVYLRAANALKIISMLLFLGCLLLIYAFEPEVLKIPDLFNESKDILFDKAELFYWALGIFVILNILISVFFSFAKKQLSAAGNRTFFRTEESKTTFLIWMQVFLAGINFFLLFQYLYFGLINVEGIANVENYRFLPSVGALFLIFSLVGFLIALFRK